MNIGMAMDMGTGTCIRMGIAIGLGIARGIGIARGMGIGEPPKNSSFTFLNLCIFCSGEGPINKLVLFLFFVVFGVATIQNLFLFINFW